ncbi:MAG TPA: S-adenosylmethionine:tRNA ribosyltransferase-isomerase [Candidatus Eremiobacteraceae bacterium]|nr:S-adenosylmethionine:tRNA ribosyltransferase-isomerase [Candidatus Eremiobacteraceae bacterium]
MALSFQIVTRSIAPFVVPPELEAREPAEIRGCGRDDVRLLVTRGEHGVATHAEFDDLPKFFERGDLLVINVSATVPSALNARTRGATQDEAFTLSISTRLASGRCVVEPRRHESRPGEIVELPGGASAILHAPYRTSRRLWEATLVGTGDIIEYLFAHGRPISYQHMRREWPIEAYQTVYAAEAGSAEMPSAGRPFTHEFLSRLASEGVGVAPVVLHSGVSSPERDEPPYDEQFKVSEETAARVRMTHARGGRVIAVGTTVVRALESASTGPSRVEAASGWTDLIVSPESPLRVVDGIITGLHEPRSTHLAMLEALAGAEHVDAAYRAALEGSYLWHEFGDSHLILP